MVYGLVNPVSALDEERAFASACLEGRTSSAFTTKLFRRLLLFLSAVHDFFFAQDFGVGDALEHLRCVGLGRMSTLTVRYGAVLSRQVQPAQFSGAGRLDRVDFRT